MHTNAAEVNVLTGTNLHSNLSIMDDTYLNHTSPLLHEYLKDKIVIQFSIFQEERLISQLSKL